ncbi:MAG: MFS transporter [Gammaproteobacteria bacterium]|nr:MFS transporter [Gammaproteobacteria bacterium]
MFYGWRLVAGLFVILAFSSGLGFYNHAVFIQALADSDRYSITAASSAVSVFFLVSGVAGLGIAPLLDRYDVRLIVVSGAVLAAIGLHWIGQITALWELYAVYALFGLGFSASGLLPATTLISRWFVVHRARALSIASTGLSVGGMIITPFSAYWVSAFGLPQAASFQAVLYLLGVVPIALWLLRSSPTELQLMPDGGAWQARPSAPVGVSFDKAIRDPFFLWLNLAYSFVMLSQVGGIAHQYGLITERVDPDSVSLMMMVLPLASVFGRLAGGFLLERVPMLGFTAVMMFLQAAALVLLGLAQSAMLICLGLALLGVTVGNLLMLQPLIIAERYGLLSYSRLFSWANLASVAGVAAGPGVLGWLVGVHLSYEIPFLVAGGFGALAGTVFLLCLKLPAAAKGTSLIGG